MSPTTRRVRAAACVSTLLVFAVAGRARAQSETVMELFRTTWEVDAPAALAMYHELPASSRSADLLLQVADQLLWTGKHGEALELLAVAQVEAPGLTDVYFQLGRAYLQRGESDAAGAAFSRGLDVVREDTTLAEDEREQLSRRLENRVRFLDHRDDLLGMAGAYETDDGGLLLLKFDPYINTFPSLLDLRDGTVRILYPEPDGTLHHRDPDGRIFRVAVVEDATEGRRMRLETREGTLVARGLEIRRETVRYDADDVSIEGTLFLPPAGGEPHPAVVLAHGAGLSTRYNLVNEALAFAAAGVAAFVYDKPGLGRSTGDNWLLLSIDEQARHVETAVQRLRGRPDVGHVGVWGFSQGGWVGPLAASRMPEIAFVILASGAAVGPQEQATQSNVLSMENAGLSPDEIDDGRRYMQELWSRVNAGAGPDEMRDLYAMADTSTWGAFVPRLRLGFEFDWWAANAIDAGSTLGTLDVPVLAMLGETDAAVPVRDNAPLLARHLSGAPTGDFTVAVLSGANHQFMRGDDYEPLYFSTMTRWTADRFLAHTSGRGRAAAPR